MISSTTLPRILHLATGRPLTLAQHEEAFATSDRGGSLFRELEASGLTGRGGAAFPTARKVALLKEQRGHHKIVVVNAMEGEPASHKEFSLLRSNPHLVLDGAQYLATMIGASTIVVCVSRDNAEVINALTRAIDERAHHARREATIELRTPPWRYVAGEESALTHWLNDNESLPQYRPKRPTVLKIGRTPVLVDNAETCANVGLIGRFGAHWFRGLGSAQSPGTTLVSLTGAVSRPTVLEVALGTPLRAILAAAGADPDPQALLLGGFGGNWLDASHLDVAYDNESLRPYAASVGAGVIVVLARSGCGIVETQRVVKWMANESARQCGPCAFGLPALADDLFHIAHGSDQAPRALERLKQRGDIIEGRGACHHPDLVVRMVRSAMSVFGGDVTRHLESGACEGSRSTRHFVAVPSLEHEDDLIWQ
jgi:NADH:ubiquinone oxidoreductase subunit F (NADH-binding)